MITGNCGEIQLIMTKHTSWGEKRMKLFKPYFPMFRIKRPKNQSKDFRRVEQIINKYEKQTTI